MGLLVAFGALAGVMSWISGPSRGLLWTAQEGVLPCFLQKTNKNGVQVNILVIQGCIVTLLSSLYIVMDDVSVAFFLLSALTVGLYLVMYMMMYAAGIRLRYTQPGLTRSYRVPGGNAGMWAVGGIGFLAVLFSFIVTFFPPSQLPVAGSRRHARLPLHAVHHQLRNGSQGRHEYPGHREIATGTPRIARNRRGRRCLPLRFRIFLPTPPCLPLRHVGFPAPVIAPAPEYRPKTRPRTL